MAYPIPGYLEHPADLAGNLLAGFQAGAAVSRAQAQLDTQAQEESVRLAVQQRQMEMSQLRQQQQLQMQQAYHEAQIGLRKSQLETAQQRVQLATQEAARKFTGQQNYMKRFQELGGTPEAARQAMLENASLLGVSGGGMASLIKPTETQPTWVPPDKATGAPGYFSTPQGTMHIPPRERETGGLSMRDRLSALRGLETNLSKDYMATSTTPPKAASPEVMAEWRQKHADLKRYRQEIQDILDQTKSGAAPSGVSAPPAAPAAPKSFPPVPQNKADLVKGEVYQTRRGPAKWDGERFTLIPDARSFHF